jgi:hypothetical protein
MQLIKRKEKTMQSWAGSLTETQFSLARQFEAAGICSISKAVKTFQRKDDRQIAAWKLLLTQKTLEQQGGTTSAFTPAEANLILDMNENLANCGTPRDCQIVDATRAAIPAATWQKIESLGGIKAAGEIAAEEWPELV